MFCHNISITQHFQYHIFNRTEVCFLDVTFDSRDSPQLQNGPFEREKINRPF